MKCPHDGFNVEIDVNRIEDSGRFVADIRIQCADCRERFIFFGLPVGASIESPMMSFGGLKAHLPIRPASEVLTDWMGPTGFRIR